ncbi:acylamino-acid-releasing enzyme-like isoform X2 [Punica granatum]|uniref:acylaminoacyl-peptidase n=1 Tax=Punica granatum TaxID=22663 RepID=A0A6P8CDJ1_PUNGR|nr:acylamino-acid-releasing enzyme-like isoform X2 [Punica granatum]
MDTPLGVDMAMEDEYVSQSKLLQDFINICDIDKAWTVKSENGSQGMFLVSQPNLLTDKMRKFIVSAHISKGNTASVTFHWSLFPVEMTGVSTIVPSPSGLKLLVVRNPENNSPTKLEIWGQGQLEKEFQIPQSVHGSVYTDGWFEGISWNSEETNIAYVAEVPAAMKPIFTSSGYSKGGSNEKDCSSWKGQGEFEDDWGETYAGKRKPGIFVINLESGEVRDVKRISKSLSAGQVVWAPKAEGVEYLVYVGWPANRRKLGMKYYQARPCSLYSVKSPFSCETNEVEFKDEDFPIYNLTSSISSSFYPRFSPDGKYLVFISCKSAADSGVHWATNSLYRLDWPRDVKLKSSATIFCVIPVIMNSEEGSFPGLYCIDLLTHPWLSDGRTMILMSTWHSVDVILAINVLSGTVSRVSPTDSISSWSFLALDGDNILAVSSSPVDVPQIKYGHLVQKSIGRDSWNWLDIPSPISKCSETVEKSLSTLQCSIVKIPVKDVSDCKTKGSSQPYEAIFVSSKASNPLIVILHGGPHSVSVTSFTKTSAFLSSLGFNLLIVNYRGSLGFGEEALQSLPGKVGSQDVNDVIVAIDHVIDLGLASPSKMAVIGISHGGFLTTHLIGQAPDRFAAAAARNPVCNLALMIGTTDIPDWCYVISYGSAWKDNYTEAPSMEHLSLFHSKSPISHISKVKTPTLFLLGAQDLRVPATNGLQYARALKENGVDCKIIVFPNDVHSIKNPHSDFESFLNVGVWFKKYCT